MSEHDDGGPAYPVPYHNSDEGMALADYFAAQALIGYRTFAPTSTNSDVVARLCYTDADAMIAEKRRREGGEVKP